MLPVTLMFFVSFGSYFLGISTGHRRNHWLVLTGPSLPYTNAADSDIITSP